MRFSGRTTAIGIVVAIALIQLIPVHRTNPTFDEVATIWASTSAPPQILATFQRSCQDCHSNLTKWPWYSHVAPVSWVVVSDVNGGRRHFNVDEWGSYSMPKKQDRLTKICEEVKSGEMPDSKYTFIHRGAKVSEQERMALCDWTEATRQSLVRAEIGAHP